MKFTKMHGLGNDYVYVDCIRNPPPRHPVELAVKVSDRHFGIGSDGLILICPSERADVRMRMFNADGSESEMCGNGIRCVAKYAFDHGLTKNNPMTVETGRGVLTLHLEVKMGKVERVTVDMGEPILEAEKIPVLLPGPKLIDVGLLPHWDDWRMIAEMLATLAGFPFTATCVSMGNPHAVFFGQDVSRVPLEHVGSVLEHAPIFPQRINVHFVQVHSPGEVTMRTWERGSGVTLACGTGACAVAVAGVLTGRTGRDLLAHLPGGDLRLRWDEKDNHVYMTGPAVEVFSGEWPE